MFKGIVMKFWAQKESIISFSKNNYHMVQISYRFHKFVNNLPAHCVTILLHFDPVMASSASPQMAKM